MLQIPRSAEREYLAVLGITAIYGAELPIGPGFLGVSRDLNLSLQSLRRRWCGAEITFGVWVRDRNAAQVLRRQASAILPAGASTSAMRSAIDETALRLGVAVTEHEVVMQRVAAVVEQVERKIEEASQNGELQWFNRAFRQWRLQARSYGRAMTYGEARARLRRAMVEQGLSQQTFGELLPTIFPKLPECSGNKIFN
jgi:hypothetical protein